MELPDVVEGEDISGEEIESEQARLTVQVGEQQPMGALN